MPALQWREMPAGQRVPESYKRTAEEYGLLDRQKTFRDRGYEQQFNQVKKSLHEQWQIEANALNRTWFADRGKFESAKAKLNSKYQMQELEARQKLQAQQQEQQQKQQYIMGLRGREKPLTDVELYKAQQLTEEEERFARLPVDVKPFSLTQLVSMGKSIRVTAEKAKQEPWHWRGAKKTRKSLIDQYLSTVKLMGVSDPSFGARRREQFNDMWNRVMSEDPDFANWFDEKGKSPTEMGVAIAPGKGAAAMRDKALGTTPIGRSISRGIPRTQYGRWGGMPMRETPQRQEQKVIRQRNRRTGQERISYDGGKTWQTTG